MISGRRLARHGRAGHHLLAGTAGIAAGLVLLTGLARSADPATLPGGMLLLGGGLGILLPTLGLLAQTIVRRRHLGAAMSVIMLSRTLGGAVGTAVVGSLVAARLTVQPADAAKASASASAFMAGFPTLAAAAVPALATALMMRRTRVPGLGPRHRAPGRARCPTPGPIPGPIPGPTPGPARCPDAGVGGGEHLRPRSPTGKLRGKNLGVESIFEHGNRR